MNRKYKYFVPIILLMFINYIGLSIISSLMKTFDLKRFILSQLWGAICFCCTIICFRLLYKKRFLKDFFIKDFKPRMIICIVCCFVIGVAFHFLNQWVVFLFPNIYNFWDVNYYNNLVLYTNTIPYYLYVGILIPIFEEIIFRGYFVTQCRFELGYNKAIIIGALLWGIMHMNFAQFLYVFVMGLILNMIFIETDNLLYTIIIHIGCNLGGLLTFIPVLRKVFNYGRQGQLFIIIVTAVIVVIGSTFLVKYNKLKN